MWHEARKQERKIRGMLVDYRKRAERRRVFYEKIKADPTQFLQLHGRQCKIHLDPSVAAAADSPAAMMPWQGQTDNLIDRFDVRAHLDFIPPLTKSDEDEMSYDERQLNYERYRIIAQNSFLGISEEKFLKQLHLEEQFGYTESEPKKKKVGGAAIGFNYEDGTGTSQPASHLSGSQGNNSSDENSDSDLDVDLSINVSKMDSAQAHEMNRHGRNFGMSSNDFYSFLTNDLEEAENYRLAKEEEHEKALFSGRKSRRERRAHREKRLANRVISPPSYAARTSPTYPMFRDSKSASKSPSPENAGKITYITSFGDEDEAPTSSKPTYADKVKYGLKSKKICDSSSDRRTVYLESKKNTSKEDDRKYRKRRRSRSVNSRSPKSRNRRSRSGNRYRRSKDRIRKYRSRRNSTSSSSSSRSHRRLKHRSRSISRIKNRSRSKSRSRNISRSNSRSRNISRSKSTNRNISRSHSRSKQRSKNRSYSRSRSASKTFFSKSKSRSTSRTKNGSRSLSRSKSKTKVKSESRSLSTSESRSRSVSQVMKLRSRSRSISSKTSLSEKMSRSKSRSLSLKKESPPKILPRYYGRKRSDHSSSELSEPSGEEKDIKPESPVSVVKNKSSGNSGSSTKDTFQKSAVSMSLQERLKRKRQALLNKQFKADKIAEQLKTEREKQEQQNREDELREMAIKLRRRQRERRHAYDSNSSSSSDSGSRTKSPRAVSETRKSRSTSPRPRRDDRDCKSRDTKYRRDSSRERRDSRDRDAGSSRRSPKTRFDSDKRPVYRDESDRDRGYRRRDEHAKEHRDRRDEYRSKDRSRSLVDY